MMKGQLSRSDEGKLFHLRSRTLLHLPNTDPDRWTLDQPPGPHCSVGWSQNERVEVDGLVTPGRPNEDRYYTCHYQDKIQLYMVLDGHDGSKACEFTQKHIPSMLLRSELEGGHEVVERAVRAAFLDSEKQFFLGIDPHITRKITLQIEISQKARTSGEALSMFPDQVEEIQRLDNQIRGGTTAVLALIYNHYLHIANVGDSRAILCYLDGSGLLRSEQLSVDHTTNNEEELGRLKHCGLDPQQLRRNGRLGMQQNTRSIGDYAIKGGFTDVDIISHATREPGTAEPFIGQPLDIRNIRGFLILLSDGLYEAYQMWSKRPSSVNHDLAHFIAQEMERCPDLQYVAPTVIEKVKRLYRDVCWRNHETGRIDDITLIIRNLGFPVGTKVHPTLHPAKSYPDMSYVSLPLINHPGTAPPTTKNPFVFTARPTTYGHPSMSHHQMLHTSAYLQASGPMHKSNSEIGLHGSSMDTFATRNHPSYYPGSTYGGQYQPAVSQPQRHGSHGQTYGPPIQQAWAPPAANSPISPNALQSPDTGSSSPKQRPRSAHDYVNVSERSLSFGSDDGGSPVTKSPPHRRGSDPKNTSDTRQPVYENVSLSPTRNVMALKRHSDSSLEEKVKSVNLEASPLPPPVTATPATPTTTTVGPTTPIPLPRKTHLEATSGKRVSMSSEDDDRWMYESPTEAEDGTPVNPPPGPLGHSTPKGEKQENEESKPSQEEPQDKDEDQEDMGTVDVSDMLLSDASEASEVSDEEEQQDGLIRSHIKFDRFPVDLSWEDIK